MQQNHIIKQLLSILKTAPSKEQAVNQMNALFDTDEALANTLAYALLIDTLKPQNVYPLLGVDLPSMIDMRFLPALVPHPGMP